MKTYSTHCYCNVWSLCFDNSPRTPRNYLQSNFILVSLLQQTIMLQKVGLCIPFSEFGWLQLIYYTLLF